MKKYLIGWPHNYNITDWAGVLKASAELFDIHIENGKNDNAPKEVFYWTRDKEKFLADMAEENDENLGYMKDFLDDEFISFGVFENDKLNFFNGYIKDSFGDDKWYRDEGDWARTFEEYLPDPKTAFKPTTSPTP